MLSSWSNFFDFFERGGSYFNLFFGICKGDVFLNIYLFAFTQSGAPFSGSTVATHKASSREQVHIYYFIYYFYRYFYPFYNRTKHVETNTE